METTYTMNNFNIVILAAGVGTRMNSAIPKVLHPIGDIPMLQHVINVARSLNPQNIIIVYGYQGELVQAKINQIFKDNDFIWVHQKEQLGTGHALKCAKAHLDQDGHTLVLYGDVPLISRDSLKAMLNIHEDGLVMLTANLDNPKGYGRIVRDKTFQIIGVVEEKDATQSEKFITEINTGFYLLPNQYLFAWLDQLSTNNAQQEYYLTDVIKLANQDNVVIDYVNPTHNYEIMGVNNKAQLEYLERMWQHLQADKLLENGVTLMDKSRIDIRGEVICGKDCVIDVNCIFSGNVELGDNVTIGCGSVLKDVVIANNVEIKPYSIIEDAQIGVDAKIGPFARIRPGTVLANQTHIGNFVEIKKSCIGEGSKVNHLTYIGDAQIGKAVNIGAGSVTCNYDGKDKHQTIIEDGAFIGSGTMMVAPVTIGKDSLIGAGSTITKDTEPGELTVARAIQKTIKGFLSRKK